jgi:hypothetical protein
MTRFPETRARNDSERKRTMERKRAMIVATGSSWGLSSRRRKLIDWEEVGG